MKKFLFYILFICLIICISSCKLNKSALNLNDSQIPNNTKNNPNTISNISTDYTLNESFNNCNITLSPPNCHMKSINNYFISTSPYYKYIKQTNGYDSIGENFYKECYNEFLNSLYLISNKPDNTGYYPTSLVTIHNNIISEVNIRKIINAVYTDHPEIFWYANTYGFSYLNGNTVIQLYSHISGNDCKKHVKIYTKTISDIINSVPNNLSEFDRELFIHDSILANCSYCNEALSSKEKWEAFSSYGAIVNKTAVCEGYSKAAQILLNCCGIDCRTITGFFNNNAHMWNIVNIDNNWYNLDVTSDVSEQIPKYDFFNINNDIIKLTHSISPDIKSFSEEELVTSNKSEILNYNINLPSCTSISENYFEKQAIKLNSLSKQDDIYIINEIEHAVINNKKTISFKFNDKLDYGDTIEKLFFKTPFKFFYYIKKVNQNLSNTQIKNTNVIFIKSINQNAITVMLSY